VAHPIQRIAGSFHFSHLAGRDWKHADFIRNWALDWDDPRAVTARQVLGEDGDHIAAHYMMNVNTITLISDPKDMEEYPLFSLEALMAGDEEWDRLIAASRSRSDLSLVTILPFQDRFQAFERLLLNNTPLDLAERPFEPVGA